MKWMRQSSGRSWALPRGARTVGGLRSAGAAWAAWASKDGTIHHLSPSFPAGMAMVRAGVRLSGYDGPSARDRDRQALEQPLYAEVPRSRVTPWLRRTLIAIFFFFFADDLLPAVCCSLVLGDPRAPCNPPPGSHCRGSRRRAPQSGAVQTRKKDRKIRRGKEGLCFSVPTLSMRLSPDSAMSPLRCLV